MTQSTFPPVGAQQPYGQPHPQPGFGAPGPQGAPFGPPQPPYGYQQPPKKKTGLIVSSVIGALVLIGGLVVGALFLFGPKTLDTAEAESRISALVEEQAGVAPADVTCPADVEAEAGATFSCTATLDGQPISVSVTQTDDEGNVEFTVDNTVVPVAAVEEDISAQIEAEAEGSGVQLLTECPADGRTLLVDPADTELTCTVTNADDTSLTADVVVTVGADGTVTLVEFLEN
ncbi:DUF4333 domain-containing protein [Geodermatophilus sp. SYSU D00815]